MVVVDTTTLVDTWTCDTALWKALFLKADTGKVQIGVPLVVLREFERRYRARAVRDLEDYRRAEGRVRKLLPGRLTATANRDDEENLIASAFQDVRARLLEHAEVLPLPAVSHAALLEADLGQKKPFKENGVGYRDALIWHSLLEAGARYAKDGVWLVSDNVTDFGRGKGEEPQLAPELLRQAEDANLHVRWARTLKQLIEDLADHRPEHLGAVEGVGFVDVIPPPSKEDALAEASINAATAHLLELDFEPDEQMRYGFPPLRTELGIMPEIESLTIRHVEVESTDFSLVDSSYEDAELWNIEVQTTLSLSGFTPKSNWPEIEMAENFWVDDGDWNDHMLSVEGSVRARIAVSILLDSSLSVLGLDIEGVEAS